MRNKMSDNKTPNALENAPAEIKLAVDLIYLLESNDIEPNTAIAALDIVRKDYERKLTTAN